MNVQSARQEAAERVAFRIIPQSHAEKPAISVVGLGYVGAVSMACLSHLGFRMVGVDLLRGKIEAVRAGLSPIV